MNKAFKLKIEELCATRNYRKVFTPVSIELNHGDSLYVEGENGAGKTTFLRTIAGLNPLFLGNILLNDIDKAELAHTYNKHILYIGHALGLKEDLTPLENIQTTLALNNISITQQKIFEVFEELSIPTQNRATRFFSAGQRRRIALSKLWLIPKTLWLLDEPFTALDKKSIALLEAKITHHYKQEGGIIFTSHQTPTDSVYNKHQIIESYQYR